MKKGLRCFGLDRDLNPARATPLPLLCLPQADAPPGTIKAPGPSNTVLQGGDDKITGGQHTPDRSPFEGLVQVGV